MDVPRSRLFKIATAAIQTLGCALVAAAISIHGSAAASPATHTEWEVYAHPQRLVDIGGRRLNLFCLGNGSPTVILDGGLGNDVTSWRHVQFEIAGKTRVCTYDRAGYGFSDPGPLPRDAIALVSDLDALLRAAHLKGPYVLVGQSLAGLHIRLFADRHRGEVSGMVLIDPSFEHQVARYEAATPSFRKSADQQAQTIRGCIAALQRGTPPRGSKDYADCIGDPDPELPRDVANAEVAQTGADTYRTVLSELEAFSTTSSSEIDVSRRSYGNLPLVVLSASIPPKADKDTLTRTKIWYAMHDKIAGLSAKGVNRIVPNSTHHIQDSRPDVVIATIDQVVDESRRH